MARTIEEAYGPGARRIAPGVYTNDSGVMHLDVPELLVANNLPDTEANRDAIAAAAVDFMRMNMPHVRTTVV